MSETTEFDVDSIEAKYASDGSGVGRTIAALIDEIRRLRADNKQLRQRVRRRRFKASTDRMSADYEAGYEAGRISTNDERTQLCHDLNARSRELVNERGVARAVPDPEWGMAINRPDIEI